MYNQLFTILEKAVNMKGNIDDCVQVPRKLSRQLYNIGNIIAGMGTKIDKMDTLSLTPMIDIHILYDASNKHEGKFTPIETFPNKYNILFITDADLQKDKVYLARTILGIVKNTIEYYNKIYLLDFYDINSKVKKLTRTILIPILYGILLTKDIIEFNEFKKIANEYYKDFYLTYDLADKDLLFEYMINDIYEYIANKGWNVDAIISDMLECGDIYRVFFDAAAHANDIENIVNDICSVILSDDEPDEFITHFKEKLTQKFFNYYPGKTVEELKEIAESIYKANKEEYKKKLDESETEEMKEQVNYGQHEE